MNQFITVMVTGGAGYVGGILIPKLLSAGYRVKVFDNYTYGESVFDHVRPHPQLEEIKGDTYLLQGKKELARNSYQVAIAADGLASSPSLQMKLDDLATAVKLTSIVPAVK